MEWLINAGWLLSKLIIYALLNESWLYWWHRIYHIESADVWPIFKRPQGYLKKCHALHHQRYALIIHPVEWAIALIVPFCFGAWFLSLPVITFLLVWGIFEAARGHGHLLWVPWLPKRWYRMMCYAEVGYHMFHHRRNLRMNFGQFLWLSDYAFGTMAPKWRKRIGQV